MKSNFDKLMDFLKENEINPLVAAILIQIIFRDESDN